MNVERFVKKYTPTLLTIIGGMGVTATAVSAVKATPKSLDKINDAKKEKDLSKTDIIKLVWKDYIPTGLFMLGTWTCIFSANYLNKKTQASLISAYSLLNKSYKEYIEASKDVYGEEAKGKIVGKIAEKNCNSSVIQNEDFINNEECLFFDWQTLNYFQAKIGDVLDAEKKMNEQLAATGYVSMYNFYEFLGLEAKNGVRNIGWTDNGEFKELQFEHQRTVMDDGLECFVIIVDDLQLL